MHFLMLEFIVWDRNTFIYILFYSMILLFCLCHYYMLMFFFWTILDVVDWRWLRVLAETYLDDFDYPTNKERFFQLRRILFYFTSRASHLSLGLQIPHFGCLYILIAISINQLCGPPSAGFLLARGLRPVDPHTVQGYSL